MACGIPFCNNGCPVGNLIPDWNDLGWRGHWREAIERVPESVRHLHVHEGHCVRVPERERPLLDPEVGAMTFTGSAAELRERFASLERAGASELLYSPAGPDIPRELRAMSQALSDG